MTYTITIKLAVDDETDKHLQGEQAIRDEIVSWLEGLGGTVEAITVDKEEAP